MFQALYIGCHKDFDLKGKISKLVLCCCSTNDWIPFHFKNVCILVIISVTHQINLSNSLQKSTEPIRHIENAFIWNLPFSKSNMMWGMPYLKRTTMSKFNEISFSKLLLKCRSRNIFFVGWSQCLKICKKLDYIYY